jgi:hypothetical protein
MSVLGRIDAIRVVAAVMMLALGSMPATAQSVAGTAQARAHVYLLRGLMNIFSLGMDSLAEELSKRGVYATVSNHSEWQSLADQAASNYKARKEDPINARSRRYFKIFLGHHRARASRTIGRPIGPPYSPVDGAVSQNKRYSDREVARLDSLNASRRHVLPSLGQRTINVDRAACVLHDIGRQAEMTRIDRRPGNAEIGGKPGDKNRTDAAFLEIAR